ncbi:FMN-binding negative transcriptional regulator [Ferrimicrobium sp.]|uniref:FMN-binding negative transcriptional regulator n=1 Tax=Ferrimicrobium sp. TaxID=2926050 RepID=UPI00261E5C36|nr:FMN-binding negative transcriptional regulator [Ferrimicrobium sp.]
MSPAKIFYTDDAPTLVAMAEQHPFGDLITVGPTGPLTTAIPLLVMHDGEKLQIKGHLTRTNPQWHQSRLDLDAVAVFRAEHGYVSPRWYRSTATNQQHVPTWNYSRVEATGSIAFFDDPQELLALVTTLTAHFEPPMPAGWSPDQSPNDFIQNQLKAIVGFTIHVRELHGIRKLSQNKPTEDRKAVIASFNQLGQTTLATRMQELLEEQDY